MLGYIMPQKVGSMAKRTKPKATNKQVKPSFRQRLRKWVLRFVFGVCALACLVILAFRWIPIPVTPYMLAENDRFGTYSYDWTPLKDISPYAARSVVAAEDANFCEHWGFDMSAIRAAIEDGGQRGASTISQQVVKNVFLWQGRSWSRKALEASLTPVMELLWTKQRILEVYLNVAEFDEGVFGIQEAARTSFGVTAADLSPRQAARLAAVLPSPKNRSASAPSDFIKKRSLAIQDGAATIANDGRSACFED